MALPFLLYGFTLFFLSDFFEDVDAQTDKGQVEHDVEWQVFNQGNV